MASPHLSVEFKVVVQAPPTRVLNAFFNPDDLAVWWHVVRSVTVPQPLGTYAVEWQATEFRDEILGRLGGAFHGTVMEHRPGEELFIADAYWSPPDGDPIGPMALEIACAPHGGPHITELVVRQRGEDDSARWRRYFEVVAGGWQRALGELKEHLDRESLRNSHEQA